MSQPSPLTPARRRAQALASSGDLAGALAVLERAVELGKANLSEDDPDVLLTAYELARAHQAADDPSSARRVLEDAHAAGQWRLGDSDPLMLQISHDIGVVAEELGNRHEARKAFGRVAELGPAALGADHWAVAQARAYLGQGLQDVRPQAESAEPAVAFGRVVPDGTGQWGSSVPDEPTAVFGTITPATGTAARIASPPATEPITTPAPPPANEPNRTPPPANELITTPLPADELITTPLPANGPVRTPCAPVREESQAMRRRPELVDSIAEPTVVQPMITPMALHQAPGPGYASVAAWGTPTSPFDPGQSPSGFDPSRPGSAEPRPDAYRRRGLGLFAAIAAVFAAIIAVAALVFVLADRPGAGSGDQNVPTLGGGPAPGGVRLHDFGSKIQVTWQDPSPGTVSFMMAMGHPGEELKPVAALGPGKTSYEMGALNPSLNYCFTVIAVYGGNKFATSPQSCTARASTSPAPSTPK